MDVSAKSPVKLFCGFDAREAIGYHTFAHSVIKHATRPVSFTPLSAMGMAQGSNEFALSRFLVPYLMGFKGHAIFADASDMLMVGDVAELDALYDDDVPVQCVKHADYETRNPVKYIGTPMECANRDYHRKNWASLMIMNCAHPHWEFATPKGLANFSPIEMLRFDELTDGDIGALPNEWNRLIDEGQSDEGAKILHWTSGIPGFWHYRDAFGSNVWHKHRKEIQ